MAKPTTSGLVNCVLSSGGTELSASFEIVSVYTYKDINRVPYATITIVDGNPAEQSFSNSEDDKLKPGTEFEIKAGFDSESATIYKGVITQIGLKLSGNASVMNITCKDKAFKLTTDKQTKIYTDKLDSDIIGGLGSDAGVSITADSTTIQHEQLVQYNATDWDFMLLRAQANGMVVIVDDNAVSVKAIDDSSSASLTLDFGTNIISFETAIDASNLLNSVTATSWDSSSLDIAESSGTGDAPDPGDLAASTLASDSSSAYSVKHTGQIASDELEEWAKSIDTYHKMSKLRGVFVCFGFSGIKPGDVLEVTGIGSRFAGNHYVTGVSHEIRKGNWTTNVQVGLPKKMFNQQYDYQPQQAGGLLPAVNGLMCGKISQITEDPNSEYRFKVDVPVLGSDVSLWSRYTLPDAGSSRGLVFYPEVGDEVVLGFLDDDPRFPVILGSMFSSSNTPPSDPADPNAEKGVFTKKELKLIFNDEDEKISIETPNGNNITIDNSGNEVEIVDSAGNKVNLSSSGVEISSASDLKLSATGNIEIKATGDAKIEGMNVNMEAQVGLTAKGNASAEFSASGQTTVKGAMVMIN